MRDPVANVETSGRVDARDLVDRLARKLSRLAGPAPVTPQIGAQAEPVTVEIEAGAHARAPA